MKWRVQLDRIRVSGVSESPVHFLFKAGQDKQVVLEVGSFQDVRPGNVELVVELILDQPDTQLRLFVTSITHPGQQHNIKTIQRHTAANTVSSVTVRSVVYQNACHTYHATITLEPGSFNADAQQENKIIVLGDYAPVVSEPTLHITHNDVRCGHGTAIGQLDQEQLLALQLRGIESKKAETILLEAFLKN